MPQNHVTSSNHAWRQHITRERRTIRYLWGYLCARPPGRAPFCWPPQPEVHPCYYRELWVVWWWIVRVFLVARSSGLWADLSPEARVLSSVLERESDLVLWHVSQWNSATHSTRTRHIALTTRINKHAATISYSPTDKLIEHGPFYLAAVLRKTWSFKDTST